jgi:hypothetical protein
MCEQCEQCEFQYEKLAKETQQTIESLEQVIKEQDDNVRFLLNQMRERVVEDARKAN